MLHICGGISAPTARREYKTGSDGSAVDCMHAHTYTHTHTHTRGSAKDILIHANSAHSQTSKLCRATSVCPPQNCPNYANMHARTFQDMLRSSAAGITTMGEKVM